MKTKKELIKREVVNSLFLEAIDQIPQSKQVIADSIGKSTMLFSKTKNNESTPAFETMGACRVLYGLNLNALVDNDKANLFTTVNYTEVVENLQKEVKMYKERAELFEKLLKKENFNGVDMSNQSADMIRDFNNSRKRNMKKPVDRDFMSPQFSRKSGNSLADSCTRT